MNIFVQTIFFLFPGVFWGIPAFFSFPILQGISLYEGVRMSYLLIVVGALLIGSFVALPRKALKRNRIFSTGFLWGIGISAMLLLGLSLKTHGTNPISEILSGQSYSFISVLSLFFLGYVTTHFPEKLRISAMRSMVLGFIFVNLPYAVAQVFGFDPVVSQVLLPSWGDGRAFGTLGNPNTLAFFSALCFPVAVALFSWFKRVALLISLGIISILSLSFSGIGILLAYGFFRATKILFQRLPKPRRRIFLIRLIGILLGIFTVSLSFVPPTKILSLQTRYAIVSDAAKHLVSNLKTGTIWDGAGAVERLFQNSRSEFLSQFIPESIPIDRAHFVFLDVALVFGMPFAFLVFGFIISCTRKNPEPVTVEMLGIFLILGMFHTPGIAEWAILVSVLSLKNSQTTTVESEFLKQRV